jgi:hypothetical protein
MLSRSLRSISVALVAAVLLVYAPATPALASGTAAAMERDFQALINVERAKHGLHALQVRADITSVARAHSARMASQARLHHNPNFSTEIRDWRRLSENVGTGPSVGAIHRALMGSDGHRRNILDAQVTQVGVGVVVRNGRVWVTQNFRRPTGSSTTLPPSTERYGDVSSRNVHAPSIETVSGAGIVDPCGVVRYCPSAAVTRGDFAIMLVRALDLPVGTSGGSRFSDVSGATAAHVEALASAGLTQGCSDGRFCPDARLTREQLATFFATALQLEPRSTSFADVGRTHRGSVGALQRAGIVTGCTPSTYCPTDLVTRAQTASMIARNLR